MFVTYYQLTDYYVATALVEPVLFELVSFKQRTLFSFDKSCKALWSIFCTYDRC